MKVYLIRRTDDPYEPDDVHGVFRSRIDAEDKMNRMLEQEEWKCYKDSFKIEEWELE
jgi:hypothetical protein